MSISESINFGSKTNINFDSINISLVEKKKDFFYEPSLDENYSVSSLEANSTVLDDIINKSNIKNGMIFVETTGMNKNLENCENRGGKENCKINQDSQRPEMIENGENLNKCVQGVNVEIDENIKNNDGDNAAEAAALVQFKQQVKVDGVNGTNHHEIVQIDGTSNDHTHNNVVTDTNVYFNSEKMMILKNDNVDSVSEVAVAGVVVVVGGGGGGGSVNDNTNSNSKSNINKCNTDVDCERSNEIILNKKIKSSQAGKVLDASVLKSKSVLKKNSVLKNKAILKKKPAFKSKSILTNKPLLKSKSVLKNKSLLKSK